MLPYNIASYGLLLHLLCEETNCIPGELIGNLGDIHIYEDQLEFVDKQLNNKTYPLPTLSTVGVTYNKDSYLKTILGSEHFSLDNYQHSGVVKYPLSN